jgi:hypothetical protein
MNSSGLLTCWIDAEDPGGPWSRRASREQDPHAEFSVADRDRETYLYGLLYEIGHAVANRSANPAAMPRGGVGVDKYRSDGEREVMKGALRSARQLEKLLEAL